MPRGPAPKPEGQRANRNALKYPWVPAPSAPWQGDLPKAPTGLRKASRDTWDTWFESWWSGHWTEADLPMLRMAIKLYDVIESGREERGDRAELRQLCKALGITPDGRQSLRWEPPKEILNEGPGSTASEDELAERRARLDRRRAAGD